MEWIRSDMLLKRDVKRYFGMCVILSALVIMAECGCVLTDNKGSEYRVWSIVFNMIGFGISPFVFIVESFSYMNKRNLKVAIPAGVNLILVILSPVLGLIYYVDQEGIYQRGDLFFVYIATFTFSIIISVLRKIKSIKYFPKYFRHRIIISSLVMVSALLIQVVFPQYHTTWMIITVYFVLYYALACEISSMVDGLTGLLNKTVFNKQMDRMNGMKHDDFYFFMLDVNDFKEINDQQGHSYGDFCLKEIAQMIKETFPKNAQIFRFGGDEFCVVVHSHVEKQVEKYIHDMKEACVLNKEKHGVFPDVAIGYSRFEANREIRDTVNMADGHMYQEKKRMKKCNMIIGRND